jgi:hypothetical protein
MVTPCAFAAGRVRCSAGSRKPLARQSEII